MGTCKYCNEEIDGQSDECWRCISDINPDAVNYSKEFSSFTKRFRSVLRIFFACLLFIVGFINFIALFFIVRGLNIYQFMFYLGFNLFLVLCSLHLFNAKKEGTMQRVGADPLYSSFSVKSKVCRLLEDKLKLKGLRDLKNTGHVKKSKLTDDDVLGPSAHGGLCANCHKRNGIAYPFWFTRRLSEEQTGNVIKTTFLRPSRGHVALCGGCLIYERVRTLILGIVSTLPVIAYELKWVDWDLWDILVLVLWGIGIFGVAAVISSLLPTEAVKKYMGSSMALRLAKPVLKSRGCDTFWTKDPWKHHRIQ